MPVTLRGSKRRLTNSAYPYVANATQTWDFASPNMSIRRLVLDVQGQVVISGAGTLGTVHSDGPANLIKQVEALLDGQAWKKGSGPSFLRVSQKLDKTPGINEGLPGSGFGTYNFRSVIPLLAENPRSKNLTDTFIDGRDYDRIAVNVTFGDPTSLILGNTTTVVIQNVVVALYIIETEPVVPANGVKHILKEVEKPFAVLQAGDNELAIPVTKGEAIQIVQARFTDGTDLSDAALQQLNLKVNDGQEEPQKQQSGDFIQALATLENEVEGAPVGYYHLDTAEEGIPNTTALGAKGQVSTASLLATLGNPVTAFGAVIHTVSIAPAPAGKAKKAA